MRRLAQPSECQVQREVDRFDVITLRMPTRLSGLYIPLVGSSLLRRERRFTKG